MEKFTIITPTGDRPEAFALCWKYIARQTLLPTEWIIVDDGQEQMLHWQPLADTSVRVEYMRRSKQSTDPQHTSELQSL